MQQANIKFDQKISIINKIQFSNKRKKHNISNTTHTIQPQLPPLLQNTQKGQKMHDKTTRYGDFIREYSRKKIEDELDSIIHNTLSSFKNQNINKIIIASPIINRINFNKTNYHSNLHEPFPKNNKSLTLNQRKVDLSLDYTFSPIRKTNHPFKPKQIKKEPVVVTTENLRVSNKKLFQLYYTLPYDRSKSYRKVEKKRMIGQQQKRNVFERYSPWNPNQEDDQLIL